MRGAWVVLVLVSCGGDARNELSEPVEVASSPPARSLQPTPAGSTTPDGARPCSELVAPYVLTILDAETRAPVAAELLGACEMQRCIDVLTPKPERCRERPPEAQGECAQFFDSFYFPAPDHPLLCARPIAITPGAVALDLPQDGAFSLSLQVTGYMPVVAFQQMSGARSLEVALLTPLTFADLATVDGLPVTMYSAGLVARAVDCDGTPLEATIDVNDFIVPFPSLAALLGVRDAFFVDYAGFEASVTFEGELVGAEVRGGQLTLVEWQPERCR